MGLIGDLAARTVEPMIDMSEQEELRSKKEEAEHDAFEHGGEL